MTECPLSTVAFTFRKQWFLFSRAPQTCLINREKLGYLLTGEAPGNP